jgi:erythromycin esterase
MISLLFTCIRLMFFPLFLSFCTSQPLQYENLDTLIKSKATLMNEKQDLDEFISHASEKKLVLLGEASHGTHEYYAWRDSISRRLIAEHHFNFIAVEGDFASLYELNRYVKDLPGAALSAQEVLLTFNRWPEWMWGNTEILELAEWLRTFNDTLANEKKVGFYGIDVYDEWRSKESLLTFLKTNNTELYNTLFQFYECYFPYINNSWQYAEAVLRGLTSCAYKSEIALLYLKNNIEKMVNISKTDLFYLLQNAYVFHYAERFYIKSVRGEHSASWNARVMHMHKTVKRLFDLYGDKSKGIVWAHNTHIGDASYTDMRLHGQTNIGELSRNHFGDEQVFLVGFTTYKGSVQAGLSWGGKREVLPIQDAQKNSIEEILNRTGYSSYYVIFDSELRSHPELLQPMGNRAVGVVFHPQNERRQYVNTIVPLRYDAIIFFHETRALQPIR